MAVDVDALYDTACVRALRRVVSLRSVADRCPSPLGALLHSPKLFLLAFASAYAVFLILWLPFYLLSFLTGELGATLILLVGIVLLGRLVSRMLAFPGSLNTVRREISKDYIRRLCQQLDRWAESIVSWALGVTALCAANMPAAQLPLHLSNVQQQQNEVRRLMHSALPQTHDTLQSALASVDFPEASAEERQARVHGIALLDSLAALLDRVMQLIPHVDHLLSFDEDAVRVARNAVPRLVAELVAICDQLRATLLAIRPKASGVAKVVSAAENSLGNHAPSQNEEHGAESDHGMVEGVQSALSFNKPPAGLERLAFPMMRLSLRHTHTVQYCTFSGQHGQRIDAVYFFALKPQTDNAERDGGAAHAGMEHKSSAVVHRPDSASAGTSKSNAEPSSSSMATTVGASEATGAVFPTSPLGVVFYCNPNAGFLECATQGQRGSNWIDFYTSRGWDVFVHNYRGYGQSVGVPSPAALKQDAELGLRFLCNVFKPQRVLAHGESIGGMVACHVARHNPSLVDLLVADRTFASLNAAAARLVGAWAFTALGLLTRWTTDVVDDFVTAQCAKIMFNDANDEIIADPCSLKAGVAARLELCDVSWNVRSQHRAYRIADALHRLPSRVNSVKVPGGIVQPLDYLVPSRASMRPTASAATEASAASAAVAAATPPETDTQPLHESAMGAPPPVPVTTVRPQPHEDGDDSDDAFVLGSSHQWKHLYQDQLPQNGSSLNSAALTLSECMTGKELERTVEHFHACLLLLARASHRARQARESGMGEVSAHGACVAEAHAPTVRGAVIAGTQASSPSNSSAAASKATSLPSSDGTPLGGKHRPLGGASVEVELCGSRHRSSPQPLDKSREASRPAAVLSVTVTPLEFTRLYYRSEGASQISAGRSPAADHNPLAVVETLWLLITRVDGHCGSALGHALKRWSLDGVRSWVSTASVWGPCSPHWNRESVLFRPSQGAEGQARARSIHQRPRHHSHAAMDRTIPLLQAPIILNQFLAGAGRHLLGDTQVAAYYVRDTLTYLAARSLRYRREKRADLGALLPLRCGHNGFPSAMEMATYDGWLSSVLDGDDAQSTV